MKQRILSVGLDVDDTQYHGSALSQETGEILQFQCRPTLKGLVSQLAKLRKQFPGHAVHVASEASSIGYSLQRDLVGQGSQCDVVAPSSMPRVGGKASKTDRLDAAQLAQFYAGGLLTLVHVPTQEMEQDRDLMRSRQRLLQQRTELRRHVQALLRRNGLHDKAQSQHKSHWTKHHTCWLERTIDASSGSLKVNLARLVRQLQSLNTILSQYDQAIESLAKSPRYAKPVQALTCDKGMKNIFALTMITEIGDVTRFAPPDNWCRGWAWISGSMPREVHIVGSASPSTAIAPCAPPLWRPINAVTVRHSCARTSRPDGCTRTQNLWPSQTDVYVG